MEPNLANLVNTFLQAFLEIALPVLAAAMVSYLVIIFRRFSAVLKERVPAEQLALIKMWTSLLVKAAEQEGVKNELLQYGASKKEYVLAELQRVLDERKIKLDVNTLSAIVESTVYEELTRQKVMALWPPPPVLQEPKDAETPVPA